MRSNGDAGELAQLERDQKADQRRPVGVGRRRAATDQAEALQWGKAKKRRTQKRAPTGLHVVRSTAAPETIEKIVADVPPASAAAVRAMLTRPVVAKIPPREDDLAGELVSAARSLANFFAARARDRSGTPADVEAIVLAYQAVFGVHPRDAWILALLEGLDEAQRLVVRHANDSSGGAEPGDLLQAVEESISRNDAVLPPWFSVDRQKLLSWLIVHYGGAGRGGKHGKLSEATIRALLQKPKKLATAIEAKAPALAKKLRTKL